MGHAADPRSLRSPSGLDRPRRFDRLSRVGRLLFSTAAAVFAAGCATVSSEAVGPGDIPALQDQVARRPNDAEVQVRLGAALAAAGRCDEAADAVDRGRRLDPTLALGPLVAGRCLEEAGAYDEAVALYGAFLDAHGDARGAAAVEGQRLIALQSRARAQARAALEREASLRPGGDETVAVLPFIVDGDADVQPLGAGLAHMLSTDLAVLERFPLVERIRLDALLSELDLPPGSVDPATAARAGRLVGASRMIVGILSLPDGRAARLGGSIVLESGDAETSASAEGTFSDLLDLEKEYALEVAARLGYVLSEAERQRVLQNRPRSLASFLAFSRGLLAETEGDFGAAAAYFQEAVRRDPGYGAAEAGVRRAVGAEVVSEGGTGSATTAVARVDGRLASVRGGDPLAGSLASSVLDVASHQPERATLDSGWANTIIDALPGEGDFFPSLQALITIVILIPR